MNRRQLVGTILALLCVSLSAQQPAPATVQPAVRGQPPTFKLAVNFIEVDAVVTDASGSPVRGLTKNDFRLLEDGKPQDISSFSIVDLPVDFGQPPATKTAVTSDVASNAEPFEGRLYLMVIDDAHTQPGQAQRLRAAARLFVERDLGPNDRMAVIHDADSPDTNQPFTSDKPRLLAAIDKTSGHSLGSATLNTMNGTSGSGGGSRAPEDVDSFDAQQARDARAAYGTLQRVADWLARVSNRRKAILFISEGIDYDIQNVVPNPGATALARIEPGANIANVRSAGAVMDAMTGAIDAATRNNVAIYGIDPRGLANDGGGMDIEQGPHPSLGNEDQLGQASLRTLSGQTGGLAVIGRNDFSAAYRRIASDNSSYYVLAYYPGDSKRDGKFHKIEVHVDRPGLTVRARRGYTVPKRDEKPAAVAARGAPSDLEAALASPIPVSGLTMDVFAVPFKGAASDTSVLIGTEFHAGDLHLTGGDTIQLAYEAIDSAGRSVVNHVETITLPPGTDVKARVEQNGLRLLERLNLPPGPCQLRVAARDPDGRIGSVISELAIPDFNKGPIELSGVALTSTTASRMPTGKVDDALRSSLPAAPSALRVFPQTDTIALYAEAYASAASPAREIEVSAAVTDAAGKRMLERQLTGDAAAEPSTHPGTAAFGARVPMADLSPGPYVLTVTAKPRADGTAAASRQVPFTVSALTVSTVATSTSSVAVGPCCGVKGSYEAAVRAFAHGDRTSASIAIVRAPASQLQHALSSVDARDPRLLEAAATMHLVLAARALESERYDDMSRQLTSSDAVFQRLRIPEEDPAFVGNWYLASAVMQMNVVDVTAAAALTERGIKGGTAAADVRLAQGIVLETAVHLSGVQSVIPCTSCPAASLLRSYGIRGMFRRSLGPEWSDQRQRTAQLSEAETAYRQSLEADATMAEARLRLGRTLLLEGNARDARIELEHVVNDAGDARLSYLAHLFLADLFERAKDSDGAIREYSAALLISPSSREAYVGLSNLALLAGDDRRARDYVQQWTGRPTATIDPWSAYLRGLDQLEPALQHLLRIISQ
jgi:VWFA-related protein